jgi:hypothetical protein
MSEYLFLINLNNNVDTIAQLFRYKCTNVYLSKLDLKEDMYCMFFLCMFCFIVKSIFEMVDFYANFMRRVYSNTNKIQIKRFVLFSSNANQKF